MQEYLNQLNEAQLAPVLQQQGAMIVIAGAGSGKTRVLTFRIAYLMSKGIDPFNILALTFTNKAAREMKSRIAQIVGTSKSGAILQFIYKRINRVRKINRKSLHLWYWTGHRRQYWKIYGIICNAVANYGNRFRWHYEAGFKIQNRI